MKVKERGESESERKSSSAVRRQLDGEEAKGNITTLVKEENEKSISITDNKTLLHAKRERTELSFSDTISWLKKTYIHIKKSRWTYIYI